MFRTSRHSRSLLKIIHKYLQAWQTFLSFYNFWKMFRTSRHSRSLEKQYLQAWQKFLRFNNFWKMYMSSRLSRSLLKIIQKYLQAWQTFHFHLEKCLVHPGTLGVFQKSCKNIYKHDRHSWASTTEKCLIPIRHSRNLKLKWKRWKKVLSPPLSCL